MTEQQFGKWAPPILRCQECGKAFLIIQPMYEVKLGIGALAPKTCAEHEEEK